MLKITNITDQNESLDTANYRFSSKKGYLRDKSRFRSQLNGVRSQSKIIIKSKQRKKSHDRQ